MTSNTLIVIGNDYSGFSDGESIITAAQVFECMNNQSEWPEKGTSVYIGQGVNKHERTILENTLAGRQVAIVNKVEVSPLALTHKISDENVLISEPHRIGTHEYRYELMVTDKVDRLSDHVTGKHVGAMLLMEAARQSTIVSLECEYPGKSYGLTVRSFDSSFERFLFPLPSHMDVTVIEKGAPKAKYFDVLVETRIYQSGVCVSKVVLDLCLSEKQDLNVLESRRADQSINDFYENVAYGAEPDRLVV